MIKNQEHIQAMNKFTEFLQKEDIVEDYIELLKERKIIKEENIDLYKKLVTDISLRVDALTSSLLMTLYEGEIYSLLYAKGKDYFKETFGNNFPSNLKYNEMIRYLHQVGVIHLEKTGRNIMLIYLTSLGKDICKEIEKIIETQNKNKR